ncbi:hypothetical protein [Candidatus Electrothrix sp.]|uniref:hypothetical protein n=1 Tax=Candidatus Electrothrix sp. TaxID=2170559 RepID=UPI004057C746
MMELETGEPWNTKNKPASYSRFLLPFSYTLQNAKYLSSTTDRLHFKQRAENSFDRERLLYFTAETANVLFRRAIWAEIDTELWRAKGCCGPFLFQSVTRYTVLPIEVCLAPPRLVLFEGQASHRSSHPPLRHGFLIQDVFFPDLDPTHESPSLDALLEFNELFRYIDCPFPEHTEKFANALADFPADYVSGRKIGDAKDNDSFYCYKSRWLSLLYGVPLRMNDGQYLLPVPPSNISSERHNLLDNHLACTSNNCLLYAENRAFVWTAAIVKNGGATVVNQYDGKVDRPWEFGHWCRLLNVDKPGTTPEGSHAVTGFEKKWTKERTYRRWAEGGTWYGYSYHSGAMLAPPVKDPPLWRHFGEMYFDQVLLLLYLRVTLFAFSRELTRINQGDNFSDLRDNFKELRASFAKFTNLYQFPLISNQQQGVEMYKAARESMDIDDLFKEVQEEISSTHDFLEMKANRRLGKTANFIAFLAFIAAFGSLLPEKPRESIFDFVTEDWSRSGIILAIVLFLSLLRNRLWICLKKKIF